jgi:hypothetical protein
MNILYYMFFYIHVLPEFVFCIAVCVALCVGCCITLRVVQVHSVTVVCTVKKISPSETKFCVCVIYFSRTLKLYKCGPDHKMCIYADSSSFPQFVWDKI